MFSLITAAILVFGYVVAQDPDCDYRQSVAVNTVYYIDNTYGPGRTCRYIASCPTGYNLRLDCRLNMPYTTNCSGDRFLISETGDPVLTQAKAYCGRQTLSVVSVGTAISAGLIGKTSGSYSCNLTAQPAATTVPPSVCRCGERKNTRIVGGQPTKPNEYTMMAGLVERAVGMIYCGGVIISDRYVMTAAHCVDRFKNNPSALVVVVGVYYIEGDNTGKTYVISRFIIHENFNPNTYDYDIALVLLARAILFSDTVQPVCLPFKYEGADFTGVSVTILGWGTTSFGGPTSNELRKVDVNVISLSRCRSLEGNFITDRQLCTNATRKDACQFDSGGPVVYIDSANGLVFSVGIVSYGNKCATGGAGINTFVNALLRWVINNANANFCIIR